MPISLFDFKEDECLENHDEDSYPAWSMLFTDEQVNKVSQSINTFASSKEKKTAFKVSNKVKAIPTVKRYKLSKAIRNDLTHLYPKMFMNIFNSQNFNLLFQFFEKYFHPEFVHHQIKKVVQEENAPTFSYCLQGPQNAALLWYVRLINAPDAVVNITNTKVITRKNGTFVSESTYECRGTMLRELPHDRAMSTQFIKAFLRTSYADFSIIKTLFYNNVHLNDSNVSPHQCNDSLDYSDELLLERLAHIHPRILNGKGTMKFYMDENKCIRQTKFNVSFTLSNLQSVESCA